MTRQRHRGGSSGLQVLRLTRVSLRSPRLHLLSDALKVNQTLTMLNLAVNEIGKAGTGSLSVALKINNSLTRLEFVNNGITDTGDFHIAVQCTTSIESSLPRNQQLPSLMQGAAVSLELASGLQYPAEISTLLIQQMAALPPSRQQEGIATIKGLSAAINYPSKQS
jgi:hypothetical protein